MGLFFILMKNIKSASHNSRFLKFSFFRNKLWNQPICQPLFKHFCNPSLNFRLGQNFLCWAYCSENWEKSEKLRKSILDDSFWLINSFDLWTTLRKFFLAWVIFHEYESFHVKLQRKCSFQIFQMIISHVGYCKPTMLPSYWTVL